MPGKITIVPESLILMQRLIPLLLVVVCLVVITATTSVRFLADLHQENSAVAQLVTHNSVASDGSRGVLTSKGGKDVDESRAASVELTVADSGKPRTGGFDVTSPLILLSGYCFLIIAASLFGGLLPSLIQLTHVRMQTIVSFVGGLMLGISVFHLIPHAVGQLGDMDTTMVWMISGILLMFFLIRTFHFHNHGVAEDTRDEDCDPCGQDHVHSHRHAHSHPEVHQFSWIGIVVGLSIHTLLDGIALGSAVSVDSASLEVLPGIGVFLAILLHKPLDAVSITTLMVAGGWKRGQVQAVNTGFAMMCPLGAALVLLGVNQFPGIRQELAGAAMAFSAGVFLCIALSDLLPEMEFHSHHRLQLSVALGLGVTVAWAVRLLHRHA